MKLKNAAKYFDDDTVYDGYTGANLFKAQYSSYEGAQPDGSVQKRRVMSLAPGLTPPLRRVISVQGVRWIMGDLILDTFHDSVIRQTCATKKVTDTFTLLTPGNAALRNTSGALVLYGYSKYLKDVVNSNTDSDYDPFYDIAFALSESVPDGYFLRSDRQYFHIRSTQILADGFTNASADELSLDTSAVKNCEVTAILSGAWNPVTEVEAVGVTTTGILMDMYKLYNYQTQADALNKSGDMSLVLSNTVTVWAGQSLTIAGQPWKVEGYTPYFDAWNVHIRRS